MRLLLIGCEYAGKKTLAAGISRWMIRTMGVPYARWHDHYVVPHLDGHTIVRGDDETTAPGKEEADLNTAADEEQILSLRPGRAGAAAAPHDLASPAPRHVPRR